MRTIKDNMGILNNSERMSTVLSDKRIIPSYRQAPSLKKLLTRARHGAVIEGTKKCGNTRCETCPHFIETNYFHAENGIKFIIKSNMTCTSSNVIYAMRCAGCGRTYLGETGDTLRHRFTLHRQHIRDNSNAPLPVSKHIAVCGSGNTSIMPIYQCTGNTTLRKLKEKQFINMLGPNLNH